MSEQVAALQAQLAEAEAAEAAQAAEAAPPLSVPESAAPAASSPAPDATDVAPSVTEDVQAVEAAVEHPTAETVSQAVETVGTTTIDALAASKTANPHYSFAEHLKALADAGLAAALNPADESAVLGAVVQLLKEVFA